MSNRLTPCCQKTMDLPDDLEGLDNTMLICEHCSSVLTLENGQLAIQRGQIDDDLAQICNMLADVYAHPEKYLTPEELAQYLREQQASFDQTYPSNIKLA